MPETFFNGPNQDNQNFISNPWYEADGDKLALKSQEILTDSMQSSSPLTFVLSEHDSDEAKLDLKN